MVQRLAAHHGVRQYEQVMRPDSDCEFDVGVPFEFGPARLLDGPAVLIEVGLNLK